MSSLQAVTTSLPSPTALNFQPLQYLPTDSVICHHEPGPVAERQKQVSGCGLLAVLSEAALAAHTSCLPWALWVALPLHHQPTWRHHSTLP